MDLRAFVSLYHRIPRAAVSDDAERLCTRWWEDEEEEEDDDDAELFSTSMCVWERLESQRAPTACGTRARACMCNTLSAPPL